MEIKFSKYLDKFKETFKSPKMLYEKNLKEFTFYSKKNFKDYKVFKGMILDDNNIELSMHLPKELTNYKDYFFLDSDGNSYVLDSLSIITTYKEIDVNKTKEKHPITKAKYHAFKIRYEE